MPELRRNGVPPTPKILLPTKSQNAGNLSSRNLPSNDDVLRDTSGDNGFCGLMNASEKTLSELIAMQVPYMHQVDRLIQIATYLLAERQDPSANQSPPPLFAPRIPPTALTQNPTLFELFPDIPRNTLLEIVRHQFLPLDLCKLRHVGRPQLTVEPNAVSMGRSGTLKDYPSLQSIIIPLSTYFRILQAWAASANDAETIHVLGNGAMLYTAHLLDLEQRYEWGTVLEYHLEFHRLQRLEMLKGTFTGWALTDANLMKTLDDTHRIAQADMEERRFRPARPPIPLNEQVCFAFNRGQCTNSGCERLHKCRICKLFGHGERACRRRRA